MLTSKITVFREDTDFAKKSTRQINKTQEKSSQTAKTQPNYIKFWQKYP